MNEKIIYALTEELVEAEAENLLERELTEKELDAVIDEITDNFDFTPFVQDSIWKVIDGNELSEKGKVESVDNYKSDPNSF